MGTWGAREAGSITALQTSVLALALSACPTAFFDFVFSVLWIEPRALCMLSWAGLVRKASTATLPSAQPLRLSAPVLQRVLLDIGKDARNQREGTYKTLVPLGPNPGPWP